jgi:putative RNA 2'-phosphotransferase
MLPNNNVNYSELSKIISHALRHEPWLYELELDSEGWVSVELLMKSLHGEKPEWNNLEMQDLENMIFGSDKKRHEIHKGYIRALYGHSLSHKLSKEIGIPPDVLYHGTHEGVINFIESEGLKPMNRQYVHLSVDIDTALNVGKRKSKQPVLLTIKSNEAHSSGVKFYKGNSCVWLADNIPPEFITATH